MNRLIPGLLLLIAIGIAACGEDGGGDDDADELTILTAAAASAREDLGLFWSNDPATSIVEMVAAIDGETIDDQLARNATLQARAAHRHDILTPGGPPGSVPACPPAPTREALWS